ncbi:ATP-binding protein [Prevotella copri]|jgi:predicted AAA+ superfamily ATPase|uniref:ATP-binding protein n=1 Tax=Segatella copri TaxID=165179 RepID=A0AAW4N2D4_9BACT|nr:MULTISPECIES: ATP-binding protein [Prevotellaceae]MBU9907816.1 ATP-binding protein [Segatella copri]MBV3373343.1 ATP-binding protein [Segatella copri]MBV3387660.1 ATP-binding protein [Segatella copri]MBV3395476.1 ATP-binding protein [Segatella copri]MBV3404363.1 ATP-binding protein [Segatella copri]
MRISRDIISTFKEWKDAPMRKPILLQGARQIGKTWAMETFGKESFEYCAKFDFDRQEELKSVFQNTKMPERIIKELALFCDVPIIAGKTLIIFDEIQECEEALNCLKYFCEDAPEYHIMAAGSLLGVAVKKRRMTVPVGKVRVVRMYPLSFKEFLRASDIHTYEYIEQLTAIEKLPEIILNKLKLEYRRYLVCGGMPDAACAMLENQGMENVDAILQDILDLYELDFAKYAEPREIPRIHAIWHSLPSQLAKENRKFVYKVVKPGARAKDYEDALLWLEDAGMIYRINNITRPLFPLSAYEDLSAFKLYACDCGLLRRLAKLPSSIIVSPTANYTEFKGAMAENAILQSLMPILRREVPFYWSPDSRAEIEFVIQWNDEIIPIEVKAENCVSGRSLSVYKEKYAPKHRIRFSFLNLQYNCGMLSCPSPMADWLPSLLERC